MKKCTCCGGTTLEPYTAYSDQYLESNVKSFVCLDSGHIELFASTYSREWKYVQESVKKRKYAKNAISRRKTKIDSLKLKLPSLEEKVRLAEDEVSRLESMSKDLDLTLRQQQDILSNLENAKVTLRDSEKLLVDAQVTIRNLESEINKLQTKGEL